MNVQIFVEGGGNGNRDLRRECRQAFRKLLESARLTGRLPRVIACGSRLSAYEDFCEAIRQSKPGVLSLLLVDSEEAVRPGKTPWDHLKARKGDGWHKPDGASDDDCHLMVQCMEAWFLADREKLAEYFEQYFHVNSLPKGSSLEEIDKEAILKGLENATRKCKKKYDKGEHSFEILEMLDANAVAQKSSHAKRLFDYLGRVCK